MKGTPMAEMAPLTPNTSELSRKYPRTQEHLQLLAEQRQRVSAMLGGYSAGLLAVIGPCAMTGAEESIKHETVQLAGLTATDPSLHWLYRAPVWKPRTNKQDWHGLETTDPETAYRIMMSRAAATANMATEIGMDPRHLSRYGSATTLAWKGGRNNAQSELTDALALHDPLLPVAVKNGLDGDIFPALGDVERIETARRCMGARAILLFRGGLNATNPDAWERQYLYAHALTGGRFLVDWAHGGEQAHDPQGQFGKSVIGQVACMEHTIDIVQRTGKAPTGIFAEASDVKSPTDPVMSFSIAIQGVQQLAKVKQSL